MRFSFVRRTTVGTKIACANRRLARWRFWDREELAKEGRLHDAKLDQTVTRCLECVHHIMRLET